MKLLRLLLCSLTVIAPLTAPAQAPAHQPFLWRIEGQKPSYIFGTIHLASPDVTKLSPATTRAVDGADAFFAELPLDSSSQLKLAGALMSDGKPLSEILPKDLYKRAEAELKRINPALTLQPFEKMKVWALGVTIGMIEEQLKYMGAPTLDAVLYNRASAAGKDVGGLETVEEQLAVFDQYSTDEQIRMLRGGLDDIERARRDGRSPIDELRASYLSGDLAKVEKTTNEWMENIEPELRKSLTASLFTKRNQLMAERIDSKLKAAPGKSFFFAVGAGHLYGPDGVIALLEKAGHRLTRVSE